MLDSRDIGVTIVIIPRAFQVGTCLEIAQCAAPKEKDGDKIHLLHSLAQTHPHMPDISDGLKGSRLVK